MSDGNLFDAARRWVVEQYPYNSNHLLNTLEWLDRFAPDSREAVRLAALTHDMERAFPGPDQPVMTTLTDPEYNRLHSERSARIVSGWFREHGAEPELVGDIGALVLAHEVGGWPEANLVQAADSISFLDANVELALNFVRTGRFTGPQVRAKLDYSYNRIQVSAVHDLAWPYLQRARARLAELAPETASADDIER